LHRPTGLSLIFSKTDKKRAFKSDERTITEKPKKFSALLGLCPPECGQTFFTNINFSNVRKVKKKTYTQSFQEKHNNLPFV
jgi:hypothetical protein